MRNTEWPPSSRVELDRDQAWGLFCCGPWCPQSLVIMCVFGKSVTDISQQVLLWLKVLWRASPTSLCTTASFGLYPSLVTSVTAVVSLFYFLLLNCCKINWKTTIVYPVSFFCLHILGLFCSHVFIFPLLIFSFIASLKLLFSIFMSLDISEKPNKIFRIAVSS